MFDELLKRLSSLLKWNYLSNKKDALSAVLWRSCIQKTIDAYLLRPKISEDRPLNMGIVTGFLCFCWIFFSYPAKSTTIYQEYYFMYLFLILNRTQKIYCSHNWIRSVFRMQWRHNPKRSRSFLKRKGVIFWTCF